MHRALLTSSLVAAIAASLALESSPTHAQARDGTAHSAIATLDLDFAGGTALDYVNAIRTAQPNANIVVLGDLARVKMAGAKLRGVDVESALNVLDRVPTEQGNMVAKIALSNVVATSGMPAVFTVTAEIKDRGTLADATEQTTVISMADVLGENLKSDDALTAIQTALQLIQSAQPAEIKFHQETGLLIARGSPEQIVNVRQVVEQLRERQGAIDARSGAEAAQRMQREQMLIAADRDSKNRVEAEALARELVGERTRAELLQQTVDDLRRQSAALENELRAARADRDRLMQRLSELETQIRQERTP